MVLTEQKEETGLLALEERFSRTVNQLADKELAPYVKEAWRCYTAQAYTSSIVWIWQSIVYYIRRVVSHVGKDVFEFKYGKEIKTLEDVTDDDLIKTCTKMNLFQLEEKPDLLDWLNNFRRRRNDLAHGKWFSQEASPREAVKYVEEAVVTLLRYNYSKHRFVLRSADVTDLAMRYEDDFKKDRVLELVSTVTDKENLPRVCHSLLDQCRGNPPKNNRVLRTFWHTVYEHVKHPAHLKIITHAIGLLADTFGLQRRFKNSKWRIGQTLDEENTDINISNTCNEEGFWRLFRMNAWTITDLPNCHREGFYLIILHLLESGLDRKEQYGETLLRATDLTRIGDSAPEQYRSNINQMVAEFRRSYANP